MVIQLQEAALTETVSIQEEDTSRKTGGKN